ncbi:MAG: hypothetical protein AAFV53_41240, partial [Myxococcota bacterium]
MSIESPADGIRPAWTAAVMVLLGTLAATILATMWLTGGMFVYTLDDPYIHFALAEQLAQGHYGVNSGELSAPSSSVLWAPLLTPLAWMPGFEYAALFLNLAITLLTLRLMTRIVGASLSDAPSASRTPLSIALMVVLVFSTNLVGLILTGMEHSLQVLLATAMAYGMLTEARTGAAPRWLWAAIILGPLVRYENLAMSAPTLGFLLARGHRRPALLAGLALAASLG